MDMGVNAFSVCGARGSVKGGIPRAGNESLVNG